MNAPCHKCEDREVGCHSKCERYQQYAEHQREMYKMREVERKARNINIDAVRRNKRRKNKR